MSTTANLDTPPAPTAIERVQRLAGRASGESAIWLLFALIVICVVFSVLNPDSFSTVTNFRNIATDASVLLVISIGMTFVIATAGIDLSVGGVLVFASVVSAKVMGATSDGLGGILLGLVVALAAGMAWGILNGFLVARARVPALIVTLGTLGMSMGAAQLISGGTDITTVPPDLSSTIGFGRVAGVPWLVVIGVVVALLGAVLLKATRFGRHVVALGSNGEALRRSGVNTNRLAIRVYAFAGTLAGLAGFLSLARFSATTLSGHNSDNLQAVSAVVLGGTSLFGGVASVFGTVVGVLIPTTLQNGFVISDVQPFWQQIAIGAVLIAAVYIDQLRRSARQQGGR
jgi:ribose transport system permease protein